MTNPTCESVFVAAMALADGYQAEMSPNQIEMHLANCPDCRRELDQLAAIATLLDSQKRQPRIEHIWTSIEARLIDAPVTQNPSTAWNPFILLGVLLVCYKLVEMIPDRDFGLLFKIIPILLVVAFFGYLKVNPFKINTELRLEGEE
jgi:predicted anti-sigma-YlaC factor YlaD